jgi:4-carboxymuconolactone decarboxylase
MLSDYDVVRAADAMMHEFGDRAELQAAKYADLMLGHSNRTGLLIWAKIWRTIAEQHPSQTGLPHWRGRAVSLPADNARRKGLNMARLPPIISKEQIPAKDHTIVDAIVQSRGAIQGPFTMFLHCPELAGRLAHLGAFVRFEGSLDMRVRVLAAMTVARELEAVYVWGAQTGGARRLGVPETTITAIRENHSRGIPPEDAEIVDFTRQLLRKHRVDDAIVRSLQKRFGSDGFIQLTGAIGYYSMLAMTVNACELEAAPNAEILQI